MTLEEFVSLCRQALTEHPGRGGREKVTALARQALADREFVAANIHADGPERKVLYEDPELGFTVLAHAYQGAKDSRPHDHGPSWAIYGQASGETFMTDWECIARPTATTPGKARRIRDYTLKPGDAHLYEPGVLHSPRREGSTTLLRIEGINLERVRRLPYEPVAEEAVSPAAE
jgi:predicted metal-dependent enzyme (double-stranded beta helix superfamily)